MILQGKDRLPSRSGDSRHVLLTAGCLAIAVALLASYLLYRQADVSNMDSSPAPRDAPDTPYVPTDPAIVQKMIEMAELDADDLVYDLGCGDGRILVAAARQAGCRTVGFDFDPELVRQARENAERDGVERLVTIQQRDIFTADLSQPDVVMVYLLPWVLEELIPHFDRMKPGSRIVSHDFKIAGCKPDKTCEITLYDPDPDTHYIHLWITPLKKGTDVK